MSHVIQVPVPDEWYEAFTAYAQRQGQTPEALLLALATTAIASEVATPEDLLSDLAPDDPLRLLAGIISVPVPPDWAADHDRYVDGESANADNT